jgi:hypothetical protein
MTQAQQENNSTSRRVQEKACVRFSADTSRSLPVAELSAAHALGKRANTVSSKEVASGQEDRWGAGPDETRKITKEHDQPLHVRLRAARVRRFAMQDTAAALAGDRLGRDNRKRKDRVADCLRKLTDVASGVEVRFSPEAHSAHYRGLQTCGSVWHCPVCAAKISEHRRVELAALVNAHVAAGGSVWMTTYTVRHKKCSDLAGLVADFLAARRKMRQGRRGQALRKSFQVVGTVSVLEVTWSARAGWHPHVHELVFSADPAMDPDAYDLAARSAWKDAAAAHGLSMNAHGFSIARTFGAVADYIAKFGHEPESRSPWGTESEMVRGHVKQARNDDGMTPFGLLAAITDGLTKYAPLWQEYCRVFKGRKQLNYSPGLKALYQVDDLEDEEIAGEGETSEALTFCELTPGQWDVVVEQRARCGLLELAGSGRVGELLAGLAEIGIQAQLPDMAGWRVHSPAGDGELESAWSNEFAPGGHRCFVALDGGAGVRSFNLWDLTVLSGGDRERAALLEETSDKRVYAFEQAESGQAEQPALPW